LRYETHPLSLDISDVRLLTDAAELK